MLTRRHLIAATPAAALAPTFATARSVHRLEVGEALARFDLLTPGVRLYLRSQEQDGAHRPVDIWRRETRFEPVDGARRLRIVQRWDAGGTSGNVAERDSLFEDRTFRPLSHLRTTVRDGTRTVEGFLFRPNEILGDPSLADNSRAGFQVASPEPAYNFETDMEMLQTLPLAEGYAVSIPFYHPGGGAPARYLWRVTGSEPIPAADGRAMDCWVVETDYNAPASPPARFWLAKTTQQLLRMEQRLSNGAAVRKTLLY